MDLFEEKIFEDISFSSLLKDIYKNQKKKEHQVETLIKELRPLIKDIGDATLLVPLIKEYMDLGLKNDEHLIKMATIIQRSLNNSGSTSGDISLTEEEKKQLLEQVNKMGG